MNSPFIGGHPIQQIFDDVRTQISDDAHMYTDTFLLSALNSAIHIVALEQDAERLFKMKYQAELATVNADGSRAARWTLDTNGEVVGKERLNFISQDECFVDATPCYKTPQEFFRCYKFPENNTPGVPCDYTLEHIGDQTTLIFDRPLDRIIAIDAVFYIIPRYLTAEDQRAPFSSSYAEAFAELMKIVINKEQTDFANANARYQDYDKLITDITNKLALQAMNDEMVTVKGGLL